MDRVAIYIKNLEEALNSLILKDPAYGHIVDLAKAYLKDSKYYYSIGNITIGGRLMNVVYTSSISILNKTIYANYSMPIIVYRTTGQDSFSGDIIHRVFAAIRVGNAYYFLTKGDNNQALDIEFANYPPSNGSIIGRVIADVPVIGYLKLIISGQFAAPQGCNQTILH
ncbi:MAG: hypothetical protein QXT27_07665 [Pyrobaculum sp.]